MRQTRKEVVCRTRKEGVRKEIGEKMCHIKDSLPNGFVVNRTLVNRFVVTIVIHGFTSTAMK